VIGVGVVWFLVLKLLEHWSHLMDDLVLKLLVFFWWLGLMVFLIYWSVRSFKLAFTATEKTMGNSENS